MNTVIKRLCKYKMTSGALSGCQIKVVTVKSLKTDVSSVRAIDEGLTLKTSAFKLLTVANSRLITLNYPVILSYRRSTKVSFEFESYPPCIH